MATTAPPQTPAPPAAAVPFQHHVLDFLAYLELERRLSRNTLVSYQADLLQFGAFLAERGVSAEGARPLDASEFLTALADGAAGVPLAGASIQRKAACLRSFYRHMRRE